MQRPGHRLCILRLLTALMFTMAWLPGVSWVWASAQGGDWIEICSTQGARWVPPSDADGGVIQPLAEPCVACLLMAQSLAPPPQALVWRSPHEAQAAPPSPLFGSPPLAAWQGRLSRGPPARH